MTLAAFPNSYRLVRRIVTTILVFHIVFRDGRRSSSTPHLTRPPAFACLPHIRWVLFKDPRFPLKVPLCLQDTYLLFPGHVAIGPPPLTRPSNI